MLQPLSSVLNLSFRLCIATAAELTVPEPTCPPHSTWTPGVSHDVGFRLKLEAQNEPRSV
eukprot:3913215-Amphidinium_carterae.1